MGCFCSKPELEAGPLNAGPAASPIASPAAPLVVPPADTSTAAQSEPPSSQINPSLIQSAVVAPKGEPTSSFLDNAEDLGLRLTKTGLRPAKQGGFSEVWQGKLAPDDKEVS